MSLIQTIALVPVALCGVGFVIGLMLSIEMLIKGEI